MTANELEYAHGFKRRCVDGFFARSPHPVHLSTMPSWCLPLTVDDRLDSAGVTGTDTQTPPHTINPATLHTIDLYDCTAIDDPMDEVNPSTDGAEYEQSRATPTATSYEDAPTHMVVSTPSAEYNRLGDVHDTTTLRRREGSFDCNTETLHVETDHGRDGVYMLNCHEESWSRPLEAERDPAVQAIIPHQALLYIATLKRAQYLAGRERYRVEQAQSKQYGNVDHRFDIFLSDLPTVQHPHQEREPSRSREECYGHIPSLMLQQVRQMLQGSATLTVKYREVADSPQRCTYPDCPMYAQSIKDDAYYLALWPGHGIQPHPFCLRCFEDLWEDVMSQESRHTSNTQMLPQWINGNSADASFELDSSDDSTPQELDTNSRQVKDELVFHHFAFDGASNESPFMGTIYDHDAPSAPKARPRTPLSCRINLMLPPTSAISPVDTPVLSTIPNYDRPSTPNPRQDSIVDDLSNLLSTPSRQKHTSALYSDSPHQVRVTRSSAAKLRFKNSDLHVPQSPSSHADADNFSSPRRKTAVMVLKVVNGGDAHALRKHRMNSDSLCHEIALAATHLNHMLARCKRVVPNLTPGKRIELRAKSARTSPAKIVSMDVFGVIYTDLFAEPAKQKWSPRVWDIMENGISTKEKHDPMKLLRSRVKRAIPGKWRVDMQAKGSTESNSADEPKPLYCSCYGRNDGSPMVECANQTCLIGRYHLRCVEGEGVHHGDGEWYCNLCSIVAGPDASYLLTPAEIDTLLPTPYAGKTYRL